MRKKFTNHCARKTTVRKLKKAKIVSSEHIANVTGHRGINVLNDYDEADEEELRALAVAINEIMKTPVLRKSKYYISTGSFRHHNNCGSTHPLMAASEENKLPPSFSGFKSKKFLHESSYDVVSGTDNDEQSLKKPLQVSFIFGCLKRSPDFKTAVHTSCKCFL